MNELRKDENKRLYYRRMLTVTIPVVIQNLLNIGLNMADTIMIGRLGEIELASTGAANQIFGIFGAICFGFFSGAGVFVAQYYGVKDIKSIRKIIGFDFVLGALIAMMFFFFVHIKSEEIISLFAKDGAVIAYGSRYIKIVSFSYIMTAISFAISYNSRVVARMKAPTIINASAMLVNVVLNYILIYGAGGFPAMGVAGAAYATLAARTYELVALIIYIISDKTHPFNAALSELFVSDFKLYRKVIKTGMPVVCSEGGWSLGMSLVFATYGILGASALAVIQVASITSLIFQSVIFGFGNGASVIVGETLGMGNFDVAKEHARRTIKISCILILGMVAGILSMIKPVSIIYSFNRDTTEMLTKTLIVFAFTMIPRMLSYIYQCGVLRAGGDTLFCMVIELTSNLVIELAMAYIAVVFLKWPLHMCIALASFGNIFKMTAFYIRYRGGKWLKKVI
ncbi:MAG: MATE family efflux transporter [Eubacterium sp.]|nr:MATE family efflux transporter [Eubacterium sp.]